MARPEVDLPQPLSPTRPSVSPRRIWKLMPSPAFTSAILRWKMMPAVTGKCISRARTSSRTLSRDMVVDPTVWLSLTTDGRLLLRHVHPAGGVMLRVDEHKGRLLPLALIDSVVAAGIERAAGQGLDQVRGEA